MAMTQGVVVIGVFQEAVQARRAVDELRRAGFREDEIGFLARAGFEETGKEKAASVATGAVSGGVVGGVLGAAASLLIPGIGPAIAGGILAITFGAAGAGALVGGVVGALTGMGVTEQEARYYQRELEIGRTIVLVKSASSQQDALDILRRNGSYNADTKEVNVNAKPSLKSGGPDLTSSLKKDEPGGHVVDNSEVLPPAGTGEDES